MKNSVLAMITSLAIACVSATSVAAQDKNDLERIVEQKVVRVGAVNQPPYYSQDLATGKWSGLIPEIVERIFSQVDIAVEYVETDWGSGVAGLQSGRFDLIGAYNATPARALAIDFTKSVGQVPTALVTHAQDTSPFATWDQLNDPAVRIAAIDGAGTTRAAMAVAPNATWVLVASNDAMFAELESQRVNVALTSQPAVMDFIKARGGGTMVIPQPIVGNPANFGVRKSVDKEFVYWMNIAIDAGGYDNSITTIWNKYLPKE